MVDLYSGGGAAMGTPVDVWALGCLVFGLCFFSLPFGTSPLAIQTGAFSVPDNSNYSQRLHKLINYLLTMDIAKRPDIFQVSALAFSLYGRPNPVQNVNSSVVPPWHFLPLPPTETELSVACTTRSRDIALTSFGDSSPTPVAKVGRTSSGSPAPPMTTSLIARQRPQPKNLTSSTLLGVLKPPSLSASNRLQSQVQPVSRQLDNSFVKTHEDSKMSTCVSKPLAPMLYNPSAEVSRQCSLKCHRRGLSEASAPSTDSSQVRQTHSLMDLIESFPNNSRIIPCSKTLERTDLGPASSLVRVAPSTDLVNIDFNSVMTNEKRDDLDSYLFGAVFDAIRNQSYPNANDNQS